MASSREVERVLKRFNKQLNNANDEIEHVLETIKDLENALKEFNDDADLEITRGIKVEINRGKQQIDELRKNVDKLDNELSDTNRKYHFLAT